VIVLARIITRHPRKIVAIWVVLALGGAYLGSALNGRLFNSGVEVAGSQSLRASVIEEHAFPHSSPTQAFIAVQSEHPAAPALGHAAAVVRSWARHEHGVSAVGSELPAPNGRAILIEVDLAGTQGMAQREAQSLQSRLSALHLGAVRATVIGQAAVYNRYAVNSREGIERDAILSGPVTLVILFIAFLSAAALLPLVLAALSVTATLAVLYAITLFTTVSIFAEDTALVLGLGFSIDFSLFMAIRFREARARGAIDIEERIGEVMRTTGRAVAISGVTIATSFAGLFLVGAGLFSSMAAGAIAAVSLAACAALTAVPALLVLAGDRIDRLSIGSPAQAARSERFWGRLADWVVRHRVAVVVVTIPVLLACALPARSLQVGMETLSILPGNDPVRQATQDVAADFGPGFEGPVVVFSRGSAGATERILRKQLGFVHVGIPQRGLGGWLRTDAVLGVVPDSLRARQQVRALRVALRGSLGPDAVVGGPSAQAADLANLINARTPWVVLTIALAEMLLLTVLLRAPVVAIKAGITSFTSVATTLGLLTLLYGSEGSLGFFVPLTLIAVVFGLSTDYEVFLLSRISEEYRGGSSNVASLRRGMVATARSITLAGLTMSVVFFAFASSPLLSFAQLGVGMGIAVVLDVTVVRCLLVPALIALLGDRNWWWPQRTRAAVQLPAR
jgi:uncharacterized membrane protein YdfJ with MMPL/SSD domain